MAPSPIQLEGCADVLFWRKGVYSVLLVMTWLGILGFMHGVAGYVVRRRAKNIAALMQGVVRISGTTVDLVSLADDSFWYKRE